MQNYKIKNNKKKIDLIKAFANYFEVWFKCFYGL